SIGYSACHWCHVMEHESFEDEATAAIMNEHFVNIKVDMEERPDIDQIYMSFVQLTTGRGGWPMNVFLTPDKLPFFGGTYFPPTPRYGMPAFQQILVSVADAFRERNDEIRNSALDILGELRRTAVTEFSHVELNPVLLDSAFESMSRAYDAVNGGFGSAPKFPSTMSLDLLLRYQHRTGSERALSMACESAKKMAAGGIYDHLGGGFHRYSVDAQWLVPHFEKMLYDNAQLIRLYLDLYLVTGERLFSRTAVETLEYVKREMLDESGGFYSSQDADSEGQEGKFFVWSPSEINSVLSETEADLFCRIYDVTPEGNFEGSNILNLTDSIQAGEFTQLTADERHRLDNARRQLFDHRESRVKPFRDEKILTAWNGLMLAAYAQAASVLDSAEYLEIAEKNAEFLLGSLQRDGTLLRTWKDGNAKLDGYIEDYANLADGLLELFRTTGTTRYLDEARRLADVMIAEFWDEENGGFFFTANDHEELIVRNKNFFDNAVPSGNSAGASVLLRLSRLTGDARYERYALTVLRLSAAQLRSYPLGFGRALSAIELTVSPPKEILILGEKGNTLERRVFTSYLPNSIVCRADTADDSATAIPIFEGRALIDENPTAYVCENFVCGLPATSPETLDAQLAKQSSTTK
ncbi:MAG: thioredoxin domain-containing protein, partial [Acidobacteriota bacterium]